MAGGSDMPYQASVVRAILKPQRKEVAMWIFTTEGFISAVHKDNVIQVRARDRKSLQNLAEHSDSKIVHTPLADYPYRLETDRPQLTSWLSLQVQLLDYSNFKSEVEAVRGYEFASPLHAVWDAMHDVEDAEARVR